jgi:hypothetical protein
MQQDGDRNLDQIVLSQWGRVQPSDGPVPWTVVTDEGRDLAVVQQYLCEVVARGGSPSTMRSYAYDLLRWWRWLMAVGVQWDRATSTEVKDYVLWLAVCYQAAPACSGGVGRHRRDDQCGHR